MVPHLIWMIHHVFKIIYAVLPLINLSSPLSLQAGSLRTPKYSISIIHWIVDTICQKQKREYADKQDLGLLSRSNDFLQITRVLKYLYIDHGIEKLTAR